MRTEIDESIRDLIDGGAAPVAVADIMQVTGSMAAPRGYGVRRRRSRIIVAAAATAAIATASGVTAAQVSGPAREPAARPKVILTAAMVRHLATASKSALASSGRAVISYRDAQNGILQDTGTDNITFSGGNWNDAFTQTFPASPGQLAASQFAINRIVNGQAYYYIKGQTDKLEWYHDTNPAGHPDITVPDPRTVLSVLEPSARFEVTGFQTIGGMRLEVLRATSLAHLAVLGNIPDVQPGEQVLSLRVWADQHGVVHRMTMSLKQATLVYPFKIGSLPNGHKFAIVNGHMVITLQKLETLLKQYRRDHPAGSGTGLREVQTTGLTVSFLGIGQHQVIAAPRHSIPQYGLG